MTEAELHSQITHAAEDLTNAYWDLVYLWDALGDPDHDYWVFGGYETETDFLNDFDSLVEQLSTRGVEWENALASLCSGALQLIPGGLDA
jgi:hypothetical protein